VFKGALTVTGIVPDGSVQAKVKYPAERVRTRTAAMRGRILADGLKKDITLLYF
jgi:hypothetical protein